MQSNLLKTAFKYCYVDKVRFTLGITKKKFLFLSCNRESIAPILAACNMQGGN